MGKFKLRNGSGNAAPFKLMADKGLISSNEDGPGDEKKKSKQGAMSWVIDTTPKKKKEEQQTSYTFSTSTNVEDFSPEIDITPVEKQKQKSFSDKVSNAITDFKHRKSGPGAKHKSPQRRLTTFCPTGPNFKCRNPKYQTGGGIFGKLLR